MVNFQRMGEPWYFTPLVKHGNGNIPMFFDDFPLPIAMFDDLGMPNSCCEQTGGQGNGFTTRPTLKFE